MNAEENIAATLIHLAQAIHALVKQLQALNEHMEQAISRITSSA